MKDDIWPNPLQYYLVGSPLPTVMTFTANLTSLKVLAHRRAATALITASLPEGSARRCDGPGVECYCRWKFQHGEIWVVGQNRCAFTWAATASWFTAAFVTATPPSLKWMEAARWKQLYPLNRKSNRMGLGGTMHRRNGIGSRFDGIATEIDRTCLQVLNMWRN